MNTVINTEYLKNSRKRCGFSIRDMSKALNAKSPATYYNIECGKTEPKASQLKIISEKLKIPIKKILT